MVNVILLWLVLKFGAQMTFLCLCTGKSWGWKHCVFGLSSHSCECGITTMPWGNFFKFVINIYFELRMNWLDFGGQRSQRYLQTCQLGVGLHIFHGCGESEHLSFFLPFKLDVPVCFYKSICDPGYSHPESLCLLRTFCSVTYKRVNHMGNDISYIRQQTTLHVCWSTNMWRVCTHIVSMILVTLCW